MKLHVGKAGEGELAEQLAALPGALQGAVDLDLPATVLLGEQRRVEGDELLAVVGEAPDERLAPADDPAVRREEARLLAPAPVKAMSRLLERTGMALDDMDLIEINEAFASQVIADARGMERAGHKWDWDKVNVHGGAVALGHPVGASGARALTTLLYALKDRDQERGLVTLCLGGGEAVAAIVERGKHSSYPLSVLTAGEGQRSCLSCCKLRRLPGSYGATTKRISLSCSSFDRSTSVDTAPG